MQIGFRTDVGRKRKNNQDAVGIYENQQNLRLAIVADGMGGHQAGDIASHLTVSEIGQAWETTKLTEQEEVIQWLLTVIQAENETIFEKGQQNPEQTGMGTTIVAVAFLEQGVVLAHVGDSRFYLLRQGKIKQITEDHSLVNELVKLGEITPEEAVHHPRKNFLARSLGIPGTVEIDLSQIVTLPGDKLLVCSDGLTNMVSDEEILKIVTTAPDLETALETLVQVANENGGTDNITVLLVDYQQENEVSAHD